MVPPSRYRVPEVTGAHRAGPQAIPLSSDVSKQTAAAGERWALRIGHVGSGGGQFVFSG